MAGSRITYTLMRVVLSFALVVISVNLVTPPDRVQAAVLITLTVDTTVDDPAKTACTSAVNDCSLRGAITIINATITLPAPDYQILLGPFTYTLTTHGVGEDANQSGDLDINYYGNVSILGDDYLTSIISGDSADRVIDLWGGALALQDLSIRYGVLSNPADNGGGINAMSGTSLTLLSTSIDHNTAGFRGGGINASFSTVGIYFTIIDQNNSEEGAGLNISDASLEMAFSLISGNTSTGDVGGGLLTSASGSTSLIFTLIGGNEADRGGGVFNGGGHSMSITDSIIRDNFAANLGSGVVSYGTFTMERSEVSGNETSGGATLSFEASNFTLSNVTIANNASIGDSAISTADGTSPLIGELDHVTITGNTSSGGGASLTLYSGSVRLRNTIINASGTNPACSIFPPSATLTSFDYNIASDSSCNLILSNDHPGVEPSLRLLGLYGGISLTAPPSAGSIAIDGADPVYVPSYTDQRGFKVVDGDANSILRPDIGASEFLPPAVYLPQVFRP